MFASPTIQIIIAVVIALVGFSGGWVVKDWKDGAEVAIVKSDNRSLKERNDVLAAANGQCVTDIEGVRKGVQVITDAVGEREKAASAAMLSAQALAAKHAQAAKAIKDAPIKPDEPMCVTIEREQMEYLSTRRVEQ